MATKKIGTEEAKVGMVLASPISDAQGRVIMAAGSRLTPVHVKRFSRWGVTELLIEVDEGSGEPVSTPDKEESAATQQLDKAYMQEMALVFNERFENVAGNELMEQVKKAAFKAVVLAGRGAIPGIK